MKLKSSPFRLLTISMMAAFFWVNTAQAEIQPLSTIPNPVQSNPFLPSPPPVAPAPMLRMKEEALSKIKVDPSNAKAWMDLMAAQTMLKDFSGLYGSTRSVLKTLSGWDDLPNQILEVTKSLRGMGEFTPARNILLMAMEKYPRNSSMAIQLGFLHMAHGDWELAYEVLDRAAAQDSGNAELRMSQLVTQSMKGDWKRAHATAITLTKMPSPPAEAFFLKGILDLRVSAFAGESALKEYLSKTEASPEKTDRMRDLHRATASSLLAIFKEARNSPYAKDAAKLERVFWSPSSGSVGRLISLGESLVRSGSLVSAQILASIVHERGNEPDLFKTGQAPDPKQAERQLVNAQAQKARHKQTPEDAGFVFFMPDGVEPTAEWLRVRASALSIRARAVGQMHLIRQELANWNELYKTLASFKFYGQPEYQMAFMNTVRIRVQMSHLNTAKTMLVHSSRTSREGWHQLLDGVISLKTGNRQAAAQSFASCVASSAANINLQARCRDELSRIVPNATAQPRPKSSM